MRQSGPCCLLVVSCLFLLSGSALAVTIRNDVSDSQYTSLAAQPVYAGVGEFQWTQTDGSYLASGVLINNQWVLTAAHVVADINSTNIGTMSFTLGGTTYHAAETHFDSSWDGNPGDGYDIGLVKLSSPVTGIAPAHLYTSTDESHQIATLVGYGQSGTGLTGVTVDAGTKRAGTNVVSLGSALNSISWTGGGNDNMLVADFDPPGATGDPTTNLAVPTDLECCAAPGDSGGGWFLQKNGQVFLAGVTSFLAHNPANPYEAEYGDICGSTRVSSYLSWISQYTTYSTSYLAGDANGDNKVSFADYLILESNFGKSGMAWAQGDFNNDGKVTFADYLILESNFGKSAPEPLTVVLLAAGAALGLRRSRA